jgi:TonB family protein
MRRFQTPQLPGKHQNAAPETIRGGVLPVRMAHSIFLRFPGRACGIFIVNPRWRAQRAPSPMKTARFFARVAAWSLAAGCPLFAADTPPAAAETRNGYTVNFEIHVNDKGEEQTLKIVNSEDPTPDHFIDKLAMAMAIKTDLPAREKDGKPVAYVARVPFFFPIEGDEGAAANEAPKPRLTRESGIPLYPAEMRDAGIVGGAIFELQVDAQGKLTKLTTLRASHDIFEKAARSALEKWTFKPAEKDGQPVASRSNIAVVFEMDEKFVDLKWRIPPRPSLGTLKIMGNVPAAATPAANAPAAAPAEPAK